jgi:opacity protein-like surface antigen
MNRSKRIGSAVRVVLLTTVVWSGASGAAWAQSFISPLLGYNFGGDAGCPEITNCEDKALNWGVAIGGLGAIFGGELEFSYTKNFFGEIPGQESSVLTLMGNIMLAPRFGPIQPYGVAGLGMLRTDVELTPSELLSTDNTNFGYNLGGGLFIFFGDHFGIRGDIRYFHSFQVLELLDIDLDLGDTKLDFGRFSGAVVFRF